MNKNFFNLSFLFVFIICIFSCASNENNELQIDKKEYSTEEFIENKISQIDKVSKTDDLKAFGIHICCFKNTKQKFL